MNQKKINKILNPIRKVWSLFFIYVSIAIVCIGLIFFMRFVMRPEPLDLVELISSDTVKEGEFVKFDIAILPEMLITYSDSEDFIYYITDENNQGYIAKFSNKIFDEIKEIKNDKTEKLSHNYQITGVIKAMDYKTKHSVLLKIDELWKEDDENLDKFSKSTGNFYVKQQNGPESETAVTMYKVSALFGVLLLIVAFGYLLPGIIKASKLKKPKELLEELRVELEKLTDTPYKKQHIYLTENYIIHGVQVIKYEDINFGYIEDELQAGFKTGETLIVQTMDGEKHLIGYSDASNSILDVILADIKIRIKDINAKSGNKDFDNKSAEFDDYITNEYNSELIIDATAMPIFDETQLLMDMYNDDYFPNHLVDKIKFLLLDVVTFIQDSTHTYDEIQTKLDKAIIAINDLQEEFYENDSEIETMARDSISTSVELILQHFGIQINIEQALRKRDW